MKLLLGAGLLLLSGCTLIYADEMKLVGYEVVADCKYPPVWMCYKDDNGSEHCVVKQEKCQ